MPTSLHLDPHVMNSLREVMGNDYQLLLDTFIQDSVSRIAVMKQLVAEQNADGLRRCAHSLKGSSSNIGTHRLTELCGTMENLAVAGEASLWASHLLLIEAEFAEVTRLLSVD